MQQSLIILTSISRTKIPYAVSKTGKKGGEGTQRGICCLGKYYRYLSMERGKLNESVIVRRNIRQIEMK